MLFLLISFVAGVLTILAPCILPLLPVIVGRSITDSTISRRRLFTVIISLGLSVILFTLILKVSTLFIDIPQDFWKWISGSIIFFFGITMIFPAIWEKLAFTNFINRKSNQVLTQGYKKDNIWGDVIVGASLGPIFSACSPTYFVILATVLPATPILGIIYLLVYTLGLCLALLFVALLGQKIVNKLGIVSDPRGLFKKTFGFIFILVAVAILTGYDKEFQIKLLNSGFLDVTKIEQKLLESEAGQTSNTTNDVSTPGVDSMNSEQESEKQTQKETFLTIAEKNKEYILSPDISSPDAFINTGGKAISIADYKGKKVVLLDIWTYSCINCQRTIPYLNDWYTKYEDEGLVIIGLHTPEFSFERIKKNVENAVKDFDIKYPVVLDNDFSTWNALGNRYWPRKYLIDIDGYIVYDHAGEGAYDITEQKIQDALQERNTRLNINTSTNTSTSSPTGIVSVDFGKVNSPEIYFGSWRNTDLANGKPSVNGVQNLTIPETINQNKLYLGGSWNITTEHAENTGGNIIFNYDAKNVYMVASSDTGAEVGVYIDGVFIKNISIKNETLYDIVSGANYGEHVLELKIKSGTLKVFTFTFG